MPPGTLILRADASVAMGTGHAMRCLALAQDWQDRGGRCVFVMAETTPAVSARLRSEGMEVAAIHRTPGTEADAAELAALARDASWVAVDGYQFDVEYQRTLKASGLKILLLDDAGQAGSYVADLVLDQNINANENLYRRREPSTRLLLGPRYALLRREFKPWRDWKRQVPPVAQRLLVTTGGSDPDAMTLRLLEVLPRICPPGLAVTVVAGGSSPHLVRLQAAVSAGGGAIELLCNPPDMPALMARSDLAIVSAGGTIWELLYLGCATLSYARNPTQGNIVAQLAALGAVCDLGSAELLDGTRLAAALSGLAASAERREKMAGMGRELVDGRGAARAVQQMLQEVPVNGKPDLAPIEPGHRESFMEMAEKHFRELNPQFRADGDWKACYYENIRANPHCSLCWILSGGKRAGFILYGVEDHRFLLRKTGAIYELYVLPEWRRKGIARGCAEWVIDELWKASPSKIQLEVVEGNHAATELWKSLGFRKASERLVLEKKSRAVQ